MLYISFSIKLTSMKFLLPHRFKKIGVIMAPLGFTLWLAMQLGYITKLLTYIFGETETSASYHIANVIIAIISFFSFLGGLYFVSFSKEKIEDEMVQKTRLDSFQFAALVQIIFSIAGFIFILFAGDPDEGGLMLFFISMIILFWISFLGRFNYVLHIKFRQ